MNGAEQADVKAIEPEVNWRFYMIDIVGNKCCGCTACVSICPKKCISMKDNSEGFLYPQIDTALCVSCGLCEKVCPVIQKKVQVDLKEAYAAITNDRETLFNSSSGGLFAEIAKIVLAEGGCVFGAAFSYDFYSVHHIMVENEENLSLLRSSKYVQSEMGNCYLCAKEQLQNGRIVLFSGTTCQIAGLKRFLGRKYDNLLCIDVICHGTPSPLLWETYLKQIEAKNRGKAVAVNFRYKENIFRLYGMDMPMNDDRYYYNNKEEDPFMQMFLEDYCLRESCYHCVAKENGSVADLTIGDFWGVEKVEPDLESINGISLAIIHTKKGKYYLEEVKSKMKTCRTSYEGAIERNGSYNHSAARPRQRDSFFDDLNRMSWDAFERKYVKKIHNLQIKRRLFNTKMGKIVMNLKNTILEKFGYKPQFQYGVMVEIQNNQER